MPHLRQSSNRFFIPLLLLLASGLLLSWNITEVPAQSGNDPSVTLIRLRTGEYDPLAETQPSRLLSPSDSTEQNTLRLIQFPGPIQESWYSAVQQSGLRIVSYIPDYTYLVWGNRTQIDRLSESTSLRWQGEFLPEYALHPALTAQAFVANAPTLDEKKPNSVVVDIQVLNQPELAPILAEILQAASVVHQHPYVVLEYQNLSIELPEDRLIWLASQPGVVDVAPHQPLKLLDEVQGQIMAGNLNAAGYSPSGPGYLGWLLSRQFSTAPDQYPIIDITDDGLDDGDNVPTHADFYRNGDLLLEDRLVYNYNWTSDALANGVGGHGTLNASVALGYNQRTSPTFLDPEGFLRGLGINPFGRLAGSKVFLNSGYWGSNRTFSALIQSSYLGGARISSNSWGASTFGDYTQNDQSYDFLVRDALANQPGNQEMTILFAAGNDGSTLNSITSPGNAKNVITVGASESYRPEFEAFDLDICNNLPSDADNAQEIAFFSGRGPTDDGRTKPDLVAPGTVIQGAVSQTPNYNGNGVCMPIYPSGQNLYAASSGTSHSTQAVAGAVSLLDNFYRRNYGGISPSPAMVKAYLVNSARYLNTDGEYLPSPHQGFGRVDLGRGFDATPRYLLDQKVVLGATGEVYEIPGTIDDPQKPLRLTLAWTDAPGSTVGASYVNNLDLELVIGGQVYYGNVFDGANSKPGGVPDFRNNVESIYLPEGFTGRFTVRIRATNIAGDGLPGNGDVTDQDFALVLYNGFSNNGVIRGRVRLQDDGSPVIGASVWAIADNGQIIQTLTDSSGSYLLPLWIGTYTLHAWKLGYSQVDSAAVSVDDQSSLTRDLAIAPVPNYRLSGCVTDAATSQGLISDLQIFGPLNSPAAAGSTTRVDPCFEIELPAGRYTIDVTSRLHENTVSSVDLDQDRQESFSLVALTEEGLVVGQILDHIDSGPLRGARITIQETGETYLSGIDGQFEIQLLPGSYQFSVDLPMYQPIYDSVLISQSNIEERQFELQSARMQLAPLTQTSYQLQLGEVISASFDLSNSGDAPLTFHTSERGGDSHSVGPDDGGYTYVDSRFSQEVIYEWPLGGVETRLAMGDDDAVDVDLPFPFNYYGRTYTTIRIGNNGAATFDMEFGPISQNNVGLDLLQQSLLAPLWSDLDDERGYVAYRTLGDQPERQFVIEWSNRPHYNNFGEATFALVLFENTHNIKFLYRDVVFGNNQYDFGRDATVGIRGGGAAYLEYSYKQPALEDSQALCFQSPGSVPCDPVDLPWLSITPETGVLPAGGSTRLTIWLSPAPGQPMGLLSGGIRLFSTDPRQQPFVDIPLQAVYFPNANFLPLIRH